VHGRNLACSGIPATGARAREAPRFDA
jgi:hypothetical protein